MKAVTTLAAAKFEYIGPKYLFLDCEKNQVTNPLLWQRCSYKYS